MFTFVAGSSSTFEFDISNDFQVIFKHMNKKDAVTRMKALQDFGELCAGKNCEELMKVGKFWFRIYRKMANVSCVKFVSSNSNLLLL